jgi:hypothetical protein
MADIDLARQMERLLTDVQSMAQELARQRIVLFVPHGY